MAVKGKKKSQKRGSQGRRRPAQAPRPAYVAHAGTPWYRTPLGLVAALVTAIVATGLLVTVLTGGEPGAGRATATPAELDGYTGSVRSLLQRVRTPVAQMQTVESNSIPPGLSTAATGWSGQLSEAADEAGNISSASGLESSRRLYSEAVLLYLDAAKTYGLAATLDGERRQEAVARAADQRDRANAIWDVATNLLEGARSEAGLTASGITSPASLAPGAQTQPTPTPTSDGTGQGKGGGKNTGDK